MTNGINFRTWEEAEKKQIAQRNIEAAERILAAAGITQDNPNYKRYYNATLQNVHNAGRFAVKDAATGNFMTYNEQIEAMFIETLKNSDMTIEQYEQATKAFKDSFTVDQLELAQRSTNGNFSHTEGFTHQKAVDDINASIKEGLDMRREFDVHFPEEFYREDGGLQRLVYEIPEEFRSGADIVQEAAERYGMRFEEVDGKKYFIDSKGNTTGPSKFFSSKGDQLQKRLLDKIGINDDLLDMADTELLNVIKSGDYQAFNALRAQRKGKGNPQLMSALSDEHIFRDVSQILQSPENMDKTKFIDELRNLTETYNRKAVVVQADASKAAWGSSIDRIMLSATPYDVATQSTFRNWQSCMHTTGCNWHYVDDSIGAGSIIAYGYNSKNPQQMISRVLLHPYTNENGDVAYMRNPRVYGEENSAFNNGLEQITTSFNEGKSGVYTLNKDKTKRGRVYVDSTGGFTVQENVLLNGEEYIKTHNELKDIAIAGGTDLSHCDNLILNNVSLGKDIKLPENVTFIGTIPSGTDLSSAKNLTLPDKSVLLGTDLKLPENVKFSDGCAIEGHIPDKMDLRNVKDLKLSGEVSLGKDVKLPDSIYIEGHIHGQTDLSQLKEVILRGNKVYLEENLKLPDNVKISDGCAISGHIPDKMDLSNVKDLTFSGDISLGNDVKLPDNVKLTGKIPDGTDLSHIRNLTLTEQVIIGESVKLPDNVTISGKLRNGSDLRNVKNLKVTGDIDIENFVKLPENVLFDEDITISGHIPDNLKLDKNKHIKLGKIDEFGSNISLSEHVTFTNNIPKNINLDNVKHITFAKDVRGSIPEFPNGITISGYIRHETDLSYVKGLILKDEIELRGGVKLPPDVYYDNVTIKNSFICDNVDFSKVKIGEGCTISGHIPDGTDLSKVENLTLGGELHFGKDVKLPKNISYSEYATISGHMPDGVDLSSCENLKLSSIESIGENVRFPDHVRITSSIPDGLDLSGIKSLSIEGELNLGKGVKLPKNINHSEYATISGHIPDGLDLSKIKNLTLSGDVTFGKDVKLPEKVEFSSAGKISGYIPDGMNVSSRLTGDVWLGKDCQIRSGSIDRASPARIHGDVIFDYSLKGADFSQASSLTFPNGSAIENDMRFPENGNVKFEGITIVDSQETIHKIAQYDTSNCIVAFENHGQKIETLPRDMNILIMSEKDGKYEINAIFNDENGKKQMQEMCEKIFSANTDLDAAPEIRYVTPDEFSKQSGVTFISKETKATEKTEVLLAEESTEASRESLKEKMKTDSQRAQKVVSETTTDTIEKAAVHAGSNATTKSSEKGVLSTVKKADDAVNKAIDNVIETGSEKLNNTAVGKAYAKAEKAVANSAVGKAVSKTGEKAVNAVSKGAQKVAQTAAGKAVKKAATKAAGKVAAKTGAKAVGKSLLKKIPVVSAVAGVCFAVGRAKEGDWKGACGEALSGVAGCFPGLGTAASTAIDVGLAGRDIHNSLAEAGDTQQPQDEIQSDEQKQAQVRAKSQEELMNNPNAQRKEHTPAKQTTIDPRAISQEQTHTT